MKKRKDGRFLKVVTISGEKVYFYSTETTERKAEKDIAHQMVEYQQKQEEKENLPFIKIADEWDTEYRLTSSEIQYRRSIKAQYSRIVKFFGDMRIRDVQSRDVDMFLHRLKYGQKTVAAHRCLLNMIFKYAILHGYVENNPVSAVSLPRGLSKNVRHLPHTYELQIVSERHEGFDLLPFFLINTGCRKSEALAIRREDIDFENKIIHIRNHVIHDGNRPVFENVLKSEAAHRDIILTDRLAEALPKKFDGFLFSMDGDGKEPLTKKAFDVRWKSYCDKYGLEITAHQLRHGYATMLFEAEVDIKDAQVLMGHSDINLTRSVYTHIRDARMKKTAAKINQFQF